MAAINPPPILKFSILLIILFVVEFSEANIFNPPVNVTIFNRVELPSHPTTFTVYCQSKDNDLGFHTIPFTGFYEFSFSPDVFGRTLYFCSFTWPGNPHRHYLDIYDGKHDGCHTCTWLINVNGGCLNDHKCGPWKSIQLIDAINE
ncbi:unnamed protein product [Trifolium pratense]|uniref:Uncharacterized protein n=1 Tax=Trifolium pratense TaxID=57577 RepID=A0ACB0LJW3_TRIPR|nr:unnamed protein product [Trifolium pratense]